MRKITLGKSKMTEWNDAEFLVLGNEEAIEENNNTEVLNQKFKRKHKRNIKGVWGTFGWKNNGNFDIKGDIKFSNFGNHNLETKRSIKRSIVEDLSAINEDVKVNPGSITERFIDLSEIKFDMPTVFTFDEIPCFRLDIFLSETQGAIVYLEHKKKTDTDYQEGEIEFIMCEKAEEGRDRLTYFIPVVPNKELENIGDKKLKLTDNDSETKTIIRVIIFKRRLTKPKEIIKKAIKLVNQVKNGSLILEHALRHEDYSLLKLNPSVNKTIYGDDGDNLNIKGFFQPCTVNEINAEAKTLLLIHGTFSSTIGSFGNLMIETDNSSPLNDLLKPGYYDQILAFNHKTIEDNAQSNANWLHKFLGDFSFKKPIDIITTSRGALVAEHLSQDERFKNKINANKVLMFSAAHGCGYYKVGPGLSLGLTLLKRTISNRAGRILIGFLQNSVDNFLEQPGSKMLTINSPEIKNYLNEPHNNPETKFINVSADWDKSNISNGDSKLNGFMFKRLDPIVASLLGKEHDFVIGCEQQELYPLKCQPHGGIQRVYSIHGGYLRKDHAKFREGSEVYVPRDFLIKMLLH